MPHALRIYRNLRSCLFSEEQALAVAAIVERSRDEQVFFRREPTVDALYDTGISEKMAEALCDVLHGAFESAKFATKFLRTPAKTALVRAGLTADRAEAFLNEVEPLINCPKDNELRLPVKYAPSPGQVVMCDFRFLRRPEMQKQRRAIVISSRRAKDPGRCVVVPVSMSPAKHDATCYFEFAAGTHPFFHQGEPVWAVCDHIYTVSLTRLYRLNVNRKPVLPSIKAEELTAVRKLLATTLGMESLTA